jgi:hypothetical protein
MAQGCRTRDHGAAEPVAHELRNPTQVVAAIAMMPSDARRLQPACEIFVEAKARADNERLAIEFFDPNSLAVCEPMALRENHHDIVREDRTENEALVGAVQRCDYCGVEFASQPASLDDFRLRDLDRDIDVREFAGGGDHQGGGRARIDPAADAER